MPISKFLHSFNHIDNGFNSINNEFKFPNKTKDFFDLNTSDKYQQSIQMFGMVLSFITILIILLLFSIHCCLYICKRNKTTVNKWSKTGLKPNIKKLRILIACLVFGFIIGTICTGYSLTKSIHNIENNINQLFNPFKKPINHAKTLSNSLHELSIFLLS